MQILHASIALGLLTLTGATLSPRQEAGINFQPCPEFNANISAITTVEDGTPFDCATLSVPLDYTNPEAGELDLSLFRVNATQEPVLGTVLINFGGPGGTGAENLPAWAEAARANIGEQWHILSWDPRGTGNTIPFRCNSSLLSGTTTTPQKRDIGPLVSTNLTEVFLNGGWEAAGVLADECAEQSNDTGRLIGTAFVARDMMEIVDALGEDGLLRYYGWSYGTALGSYVAALFPDRVERMVLDANVNPHDYQAGHYGVFLDNIDEAFEGFLQTCFDVQDQCAFYTAVQPNSTQDLLDVINFLLDPLAQNATSSLNAYITYLSYKVILVQPLYFPRTWPAFAETLAGIVNGILPPQDPPAEVYGTAENAVVGIRASDATFQANSSDEYLSQVQFQSTVSPGFSDVNYFAMWPSAQWSMPANERYWGNFQVTTKTPILYVNGQADPVTPLVNARNASATFAGSTVLAHTGYGHGVFADPSQCVAQYVQAYFLNGTLPPADTRCESDQNLVELWQSVVLATQNDTSSGGNTTSGDNSTSSDDTANDTGNSTGTEEQQPGNSASHTSTSVTLAFAAVLAMVAMNVL